MSDPVLTEEPLQFGEGGRLFGILTLPGMPPRRAQELPVFVFLSAGLLHRVGPHGLHVRLGRELAQMGFSSLRVDLAGTGDSPPHPGLTYPQSVALDFGEISARSGVASRSFATHIGRALLWRAQCDQANARGAAGRRHGIARSDLLPGPGLSGTGTRCTVRESCPVYRLVDASLQGSDAPARKKAGKRRVYRSANTQRFSDPGAVASGVGCSELGATASRVSVNSRTRGAGDVRFHAKCA